MSLQTAPRVERDPVALDLGRGPGPGTATGTGPGARRGRRRLLAAALGTAATLAVGWALAPHLVTLDSPEVALDPTAGLFVDGYGDTGTYALHYRYGQEVELTVPLSNASAVPWRVTDVELVEPTYPLLEPVGGTVEPVTLAPYGDGEVSLVFEYANCRYYHERANNSYEQVRVSGTVLGRETSVLVDLAVPLVVHSQVILNCPERTLVRGDDVRS